MRLDTYTVGAEKLLMDSYRCDRIRTANHNLTNYISETISAYPQLDEELHIGSQEADSLKASPDMKMALMSTPFSVVTPMLTEVADWQCLVKGEAATSIVKKLRARMPRLRETETLKLFYNNREFSLLICELLHRNALAAPLLGISSELARFLRSVSPHALDLGIQAAGFPAFRWRLDSTKFWIDFRSEHLTIETLGHHILASTPTCTQSFRPVSSGWTSRIDPVMKPVYCDLMIRQRYRAACIAKILGLSFQYVRNRFHRIHGSPSPPGRLPRTTGWYFRNGATRLQATMIAMLHRSARAFGFSPLESAMASHDLVAKYFGETNQLNPERAMLVSQSIEANAPLALAPCGSCDTAYLIANSGEKIESLRSFKCPGCTGQLAVIRRNRGRWRARLR